MTRFLRHGLPLRRRRSDRRGIAIIVVIGTIMFLTALVTDITFGARVRFLTAVHERDEAKAQWLALTGLNLYRLVLVADKQLANNSMFQSLGFGATLWQTIPYINTGLLRMFVASDGGDMEEEDIQELATTGSVSEEIREESLEEGSRFGGRNFLDFDGDFMAEVKGEDCGINVNALSTRSTDERPEDTAAGKQILGLMTGEEHDQWLRERSLDKYDLLGNLADWVDADNIVASGKGGYEDDFYNNLASPYLAKNARFDSREEIRLVEGWQDEVFDRWGEQLTIYGSGKVNVSCADDVVLGGLIKAHLSYTPTDSQLEQILSDLRSYMAMNTFSSASQFTQYLKDQGLQVDDSLTSDITLKTKVFTITSTATVGDATAKITAVLDFSSSSEGTVKYWRVD